MSMPIKIPCPRCRFELVCSAALLGTKGQCRNCQHIFTIAKSDTSRPVTSEFDAPEVVFHCPACAQLFAGQAEMEGKKGKCHACGEVFAIALEPAPATSPSSSIPNPYASSPSLPKPSASSPSAQKPAAQKPALPKPSLLGLSKPSPTARPSATAVVASGTQSQSPIQFNCQHCSGVMEVPGSTSGQQTLCPYCGEPLTIPAVSHSPRSAARRCAPGRGDNK